MKVPGKYFGVVFGALMAFFMGIPISFFVAYSQFGLSPELPAKYAEIFVTAFAVAFPVSVVLGPIVERLVRAFVLCPSGCRKGE